VTKGALSPPVITALFFVIASPFLLSLRAGGAAIPEKQNSKIKMQNDRAKMKKQSV